MVVIAGSRPIVRAVAFKDRRGNARRLQELGEAVVTSWQAGGGQATLMGTGQSNKGLFSLRTQKPKPTKKSGAGRGPHAHVFVWRGLFDLNV